MNKILLLSVMMLTGLTSTAATKTNVAPQGEDFFNTTRYRYAEPITFVERGVEFLIFPDGSFDFNTNAGDFFVEDTYYRNSRTKRSSVNTFNGNSRSVGSSHYAQRNAGVFIQHDNGGLVRRIDNVFINYDRAGKVTRVGSVYMNYNRGHQGSLRQVGGLRVNYNNYGQIVHLSGMVNYHNADCNTTYGQGHVEVYDHYDDHHDSNDYYYYKKGDKIKKQKKRKR